MLFEIKAVDQTGSEASIKTESAIEALQSLRAFEVADYQDVTVVAEDGRLLRESDLVRITARAVEPSKH